MNMSRSITRWLRLLVVPGLVAVLLGLFVPARAAQAHPLDVYLQSSYLTVAPTQLTVELNLSPGVLLAPAVLAQLDSNGDQQISAAESQAYVDDIVRQLVLQVDGQTQALTITKIDMPPYLNIQTGYGLIRVDATAALANGLTGTHQIAYANNFAPTGASYQVNGFVERGAAITLGKQNRDSTQQTMTMSYTIGGAAAASVAPTTVAATAPSGTASLDASATTGLSTQAQHLLASMEAPTISPWALVLLLGLAALLGGLHALTPGHGKTLVAAYLVGSRGTVRDAVLLGGTVTLTHTASVLVFGALALAASQIIAATVLAAVLEWCAALLIVGLGARLVWVRWRALRAGTAGRNTHAHPHPHPVPGGAAAVRPGALISLGMAGGALPCPEALAIMLLAVGIGRVGLGLGLIVSFSFGLAAVLIGLGVLLVRAGSRLGRFAPGGGTAWQRWLPFGSAVVVLALGAGMLFNVIRTAALSSTAMLAVAGALAVFAGGYGLALLLNRRVVNPQPGLGAPAWLPPRYQHRVASAAPMGAAELAFDATGAVAWNAIWTDFCDLALAGGPPHRGTLLEAPTPEAVRADPAGYGRVQAELARGLRMVTNNLPVISDGAAGWIGLRCTDEEMAVWLLRAITVENVAVRREGAVLFLPAGPGFALEREIKNVVTVVAKTYHYWTEHSAIQQS